MLKRLASGLTLLLLGLAFTTFCAFIGKTIEKSAIKKAVKGQKTEKNIVVKRIVDGDTLVVSTGETIRLIGIDTPEKEDCYSTNAADRLRELVLNREIAIEYDQSEKDRYGRTLLYIWVDGTFVNEVLAKEGYADSKRYPPNIKYAPILELAEVQAKSQKLGIWSKENCLTPRQPE